MEAPPILPPDSPQFLENQEYDKEARKPPQEPTDGNQKDL